MHHRNRVISRLIGQANILSVEEKKTVQRVLDRYKILEHNFLSYSTNLRLYLRMAARIKRRRPHEGTMLHQKR